MSDNWVPRETLAPGYSVVGSGSPQPCRPEHSSSGPRPVQQSASLPSITTAGTDRMPRLQLASLQDFAASMPATGGTHCRPPAPRLASLCCREDASRPVRKPHFECFEYCVRFEDMVEYS
jgi:hypothetical protein